jgi:hypothetical protein|tara:strand:- start:5549 stop:5797 length:249 start_codon:yes stop_codon:yes gene_type:complete
MHGSKPIWYWKYNAINSKIKALKASSNQALRCWAKFANQVIKYPVYNLWMNYDLVIKLRARINMICNNKKAAEAALFTVWII